MLVASVLSLLLSTAPPIENGEQLRAHLCSGAPSPLDRLSRGARLRLLESLSFGPGGAISSYLPISIELTPDEKVAIIDLLGMEAYREWPEAKRSASAGFNSGGYPAPASVYCADEERLDEWANRARARDEGELSSTISHFNDRLKTLLSEPGAFAETSPAIAEAATPLLVRIRAAARDQDLDDWVLRDLDGLMGDAAELSEDPAILDAAIRVRQAVGRLEGAEAVHIDSLLSLRERMQSKEPGLRRIGQPQPSGEWLIRSVERPPRFVLVSSTGCQFSKAALSRIAEDASLTELVGRNVVVLAPYDELERSPTRHERWNEAHPKLAYRAWLLRSEWPEISFNATPAIYEFNKEGASRIMLGFPPDEAQERLDALRVALQASEQEEPERSRP